jgi:type I restriction enzyme, S subunit
MSTPETTLVPLSDVAAPKPNSFVDGPFGSEMKSDEYTEEGVRLIQLQNIGDGIWIDENKKFISEEKFTTLKRHGAVPGDIAIAKMADPVARSCLLPSVAKQFIVVADCIKLTSDRSKYDAGFVSRAINSHNTRREAELKSSGTTRLRINLSALKTVHIWAPLLPEQSRITLVLDTVDEAIAKTEAVIAKLKQVRAGLLHDLLTRGLDEHGQFRDPIAHPEQFQDSPLERIPREWKILPLSQIADVDRGKFGHRPRNDPGFYGGTFPFIQTGDVAVSDGDIITNASQNLNERGAAVSKKFPTETIAVTIAANIGDTAILGSPMYFPDSVVGVITHPPNAVRWVELALRRAKQRLNALAPQSAQKNINLEFLRPLPVPVPSPAEQQRCSNVYQAVSDEIKAEEAIREKLTAMKSGLMTDLLTGRVRVPQTVSTSAP